MIIGQKVFKGETLPAVMAAHLRPLVLPHTWPEGIPSGVAEVLATALAKKPANRYATAGKMAKALAATATLVKGKSTTPQPIPAKPAMTPAFPSILTTKLYPPPTRPEFVPRPRLIERLNDGLQRTQAKSEIVEPLSQRELEVLQLIAEGLTNQEVATRLFLTLNTVKAHTRNIYGKLGVNSRPQAVARARALGILPSI